MTSSTVRPTPASIPAFDGQGGEQDGHAEGDSNDRQRRPEGPRAEAPPGEWRQTRHLQPELGEPRDQRSGRVVGSPAEHDLVPNPAVLDHLDPIGVGSRLGIVGDEDDRLAALVARAPEGLEDLAARREVEVAGRLVGQHDRRSIDQGPGDRDPLLLAGRQLVGPMALLAGEVDQLEDVADSIRRDAPARDPGRRS